MRAIFLTALILASGFFAISREIEPAQRGLTPDSFPIPMPAPVGPFRVYPEYDTARAFAGGSVKLTITIRGDSDPASHKENLKLIKCEPKDGEASPLQIRPEDEEKTPEPGFFVTRYTYIVDISEKAAPRSYDLSLSFQYLNGPVINRTFSMEIGVLTNGPLHVVREDEQEEEVPPFYPFRSSSYVITLRNDSSRYDLNVRKIAVESVSPGLIEFTDNAMTEPPFTLKVRQQKQVVLRFNVRMEGDNYLWGFGDKPKLKVIITYDDGYGRVVSDYSERFPIRARIPNYVLVIAMMLGVLFGCLIRYYLEYLARHRKIKSGELLKFIFYTVVFGMVVAAFALFGQIKVTAFEKFTGSFDKPLVIFFVGLAGAVAGLQLFVSWYNSLVPKDGH